jgi:hypothetical protein
LHNFVLTATKRASVIQIDGSLLDVMGDWAGLSDGNDSGEKEERDLHDDMTAHHTI